MGISEVILLNLCANLTCPGDKIHSIAEEKRHILYQQAEALQNYTLRIATVHNPPLSSIETINGTLVAGGIAFQYIDILQEKFGFNYELIMPEKDSLSVEEDGIVGMLHRNKVDVAAAFLPILSNISSYVTFSYGLGTGEWVVLMNRPPVSATGSGLLAPFTFHVWLLILVSLFAVGPIIYLLIVLKARLCRTDDSKVYPLPSCVWFVYGALLKQGSTLSPETDSSRILFATWWIFITILTAFYTANLTAFLTLSRFTLPISSVSDIGTKKSSWVAQKGSAIEEVLKTDIDFKRNLAGSHGQFLGEESSIILENWVKRSGYMYIGEKPIVEHLMYNDYLKKVELNITETDRCTFVITTWVVTENQRAFAYSPQFPFAHAFDNILANLVESGIVQYTLKDGLPDTKICPLDLGSKERQLQNTDLLMTYYIVAGGFIVSTIAFMGELMWIKCNGRVITNSEYTRDSLFTVIKNDKSKNNESKESFMLPPPPYHALFKPPFPNTPKAQTKTINGREYWVIKSVDGDTRLIPIRTPSAFLFQYDN